MRRLTRHAVLGTCLSAVAATTAVIGLAGGATGQVEAAPAAPVAAAPAAGADAGQRSAATDRTARGNLRPDLTASGDAKQRSAALARQARAIAVRNAKLEKAAAKRRAEKRAAKRAAAKARAARIARLGYQPGESDPREIARQILKNRYGYGADQFGCFDNIIKRESMWEIDATNPSSGAYGIPQALPGSKMATVASDWRTNPATQIIWAVGYMKDRYGSPCSAWGFKSANGWY